MADICPATRRMVLTGIDDTKQRSFVYVPGCKTWKCPVCGERQRKMWAARIYVGMVFYQEHGEDNWSFCTVTSNAKLRRFETTWHIWPKAWAKLSTRLRRAYPGLRYALVPEQHDNGRVHSHFVCSAPVPKSWLKDHAAESGLGYIADSAPVSSAAKGAWYITKYLSKTLAVATWPKGVRRIRTSQHWPELPENPLTAKYDIRWDLYARDRSLVDVDKIAVALRHSSGYPVEIIIA